MKRILSFAIPSFLLFLLFSGNISAQNRRYNTKQSSDPEHRFVVGLAPFSLLLPSGKVNLHGEWAYADNKSLSVLIGVPRGSKAPNWLSNDVELEKSGNTTTNKFYSAGITVENRFYLAGHAPRGFYVAPYVRYSRLWLDHITENTENQGKTTITGAFGGVGLGGSLGFQFKMGEHMTLDATLAGVDMKIMRATLIYKTTDPDNDIAAFRDKVQEQVKDIPLIGSKLVAAIDGDRVKVHTPGLVVPAYRFNLTVNYAF